MCSSYPNLQLVIPDRVCLSPWVPRELMESFSGLSVVSGDRADRWGYPQLRDMATYPVFAPTKWGLVRRETEKGPMDERQQKLNIIDTRSFGERNLGVCCTQKTRERTSTPSCAGGPEKTSTTAERMGRFTKMHRCPIGSLLVGLC